MVELGRMWEGSSRNPHPKLNQAERQEQIDLLAAEL
jgi:hypothetical protein